VADKKPAKVVAPADASFLIGVCAIGQIGLLETMFERIYVAPAVWEEAVVQGAGRAGAEQIASATFIQRQPVQDQQAVALLQVFLGPGESETLVLAQELPAPLVLMDDLRARKAAQQAGISTLGVVGLLLAAKRQGLVERVRPLLETLAAKGFRLARRLVEEALREAGESDHTA
jgi:predicted nucleic acid-binding protein